jgi:hypothetical protein
MEAVLTKEFCLRRACLWNTKFGNLDIRTLSIGLISNRNALCSWKRDRRELAYWVGVSDTAQEGSSQMPGA